MLKDMLEQMLLARSRQIRKTAYDNAVAVISLDLGKDTPADEAEVFKTDALIMPDGFALIVFPEHMPMSPVPLHESVIQKIYEASQNALKNKREGTVTSRLANEGSTDNEVFVFDGYYGVMPSGVNGTYGADIYNSIPGLKAAKLSFSADTLQPMPEGKLPVYAAFFPKMEKRFPGTGVYTMSKGIYNRNKAIEEIEEETQGRNFGPCVLGVAFIDEK